MEWLACMHLKSTDGLPPSQSSLSEAGERHHHFIGKGRNLEWSSLNKGGVGTIGVG